MHAVVEGSHSPPSPRLPFHMNKSNTRPGHEGADECNFEFDLEAGEIDIDEV